MNEFTIVIKSRTNVVKYNYEHSLHAFICTHISNKCYGKSNKTFIHSNLMESNKRLEKPCGIWGRDGITFKSNPCFSIRTDDNEIIVSLISNIKKGVAVFDDFIVSDYYYNNVENIADSDYFSTVYSSPIVISSQYNTIKDKIPTDLYPSIEHYLENGVRKKALDKGITLGNFSIKIEKEYKPCDILTKKYDTNCVNKAYKEKGRNFKLKIEGDSDIKEFIWMYGIGRSNGLGCGYLFNK